MAEDSIFDSGLNGMFDEPLGSKRSAEWEDDLLGSLSEAELADIMSEQDYGGTVHMASAEDALGSVELEEELRRDVRRLAVAGQDVSSDLASMAAEMEAAEQALWGSSDKEIANFVTGRLYAGHSPKQIEGLLHLMYPTARVEAFWTASGDDVISKYGRLGFLYVDASDFQDDTEMDEMLGGQKKIGQMALETIKPASRCGDCTLNRGGFCMRYNLSLDDSPAVKNARQVRRVLNKFARVSDTVDLQVCRAQEAVDVAEASKTTDPMEYDRIVSAFLTDIGYQRTDKGDTGRSRMLGVSTVANRPQPQHDAEVETFVRKELTVNPGVTFAELRGEAMASLGATRVKAWFRSNRSIVSQLVNVTAKVKVSAEQKQETRDTMSRVRESMVARYGERRANRIMEVRGDDPERYVGILNRLTETETRRIGTGCQMPRTMPDADKSLAIGRMDDDLRSAAQNVADRGVPEGGMRANLLSRFGEKRLATFESDCPGEIEDMVRRASLGFGAEDDSGIRFFEKRLEQHRGDVDAAVSEMRRSIGRRRTSLLLAKHPKIEAVVAAASLVYGATGATASDRRIANSSVARSLRPEVQIDFDAIAIEAAGTIEPELLASDLPLARLDPTLVAHPEMDNVEPGYIIPSDVPDATV